jgi:hypothetical protein
MHRQVTLSFALAATGILFALPPASARPDRSEPPAVITSPSEKARVGTSEEIEGQLAVEGWPVVLVRPMLPDQPWWVQAPVEEVAKGKFSAQVQLGDGMTEKGTRFRIIVVVAPTREEALKFKRGATRTSLPAGLPRSEPVTVIHD